MPPLPISPRLAVITSYNIPRSSTFLQQLSFLDPSCCVAMESSKLSILASLSAKLLTIHRNHLVDTLQNPRVWKSLLPMLRPLDIISLARATFFCVQPGEDDRLSYLIWWRQILYSKTWVEQPGIEAVVVGKDLHTLHYALQVWGYFDLRTIRVLLLVKEETCIPEVRRAIAESIDSSYAWVSMSWKRNVGYIPPVLHANVVVAVCLELRFTLSTWLADVSGYDGGFPLYTTYSAKLYKEREMMEIMAANLDNRSAIFGGKKDHKYPDDWKWVSPFRYNHLEARYL